VGFNDQQHDFLAERLVRRVRFDRDRTALLLLTFFSEGLLDTVKDLGSILVNSSSFALGKKNSANDIVCGVISMISQNFLNASKLAHQTVLPTLIEMLDDLELRKCATKAIVHLIRDKAVLPNGFLDAFVRLPVTETNARGFVKILAEVVYSKKFDFSEVFETAIRLIADPLSPPAVKAWAIGLVYDLHGPNGDEAGTSFDLCLPVCLSLLLGDDPSSFGAAVRYLSLFAEVIDYPTIAPRLVAISLGDAPSDPPTQRVVAHYLSVICKLRSAAFPREVLDRFLDDRDPLFAARALTVLRMQSRVVRFGRQGRCGRCQRLPPRRDEVRQEARGVLPSILGVVFGILQGRVALLEHNFPFDYDYPRFKLYKFLRVCVEQFPAEAAPIVRELIDWVSSISKAVLPKLTKPLNSALRLNLLDATMAAHLWAFAFKRLTEDWHDTDAASSLLAILVNRRLLYPAVCPVERLVGFMCFMLDDDQSDEMLFFLPTVFVDLAANETQRLPIDDHVFETIFGLMREQTFDWDFAAMAKSVALLCERAGFLYGFHNAAARMFAHFLTKNDQELTEMGFTSEILDAIAGGIE
jgi:hypothetical protein